MYYLSVFLIPGLVSALLTYLLSLLVIGTKKKRGTVPISFTQWLLLIVIWLVLTVVIFFVGLAIFIGAACSGPNADCA